MPKINGDKGQLPRRRKANPALLKQLKEKGALKTKTERVRIPVKKKQNK